MKSNYQLHPYQLDGYSQSVKALDAGLRVVLVMPTGSGKTIVARSVIHHFLGSGLRVLFLSHRTQLNRQLINKVGSHQRLTVSTIQGFNPDKCDSSYDLIVVDEAHRIGSESYQSALKVFPQAKLLGLTATPVRPNGDGLGQFFDVMIQPANAAELTAGGYLSPIKAYGPEYVISAGSVPIEGADYDQKKLAKVSSVDRHCIKAVEEYRKWARDKRGIVFCVDRTHARKMTRFYQSAGLNAVYMGGDDSEKSRAQHLEQWDDRAIDIICNCDLFVEGSDLPGVEFVQILRSTMSLPLYFQMIGRGMRPDGALILLDHTTNFQDLGLPDEHPGYKLTKGQESGGPILRSETRRVKVRNDEGEIVDGDVLLASELVEIDRFNDSVEVLKKEVQAIAMKQANPMLTHKSIARRLECSEHSVSRWLRAAGMGASVLTRFASAKQQAIEMKQSNPVLSSKKIADRLGVQERDVNKWFRESFVGTVNPLKQQVIATKQSDLTLSGKDISDRLGIRQKVVNKWLRESGLIGPTLITLDPLQQRAIEMKQSNPALSCKKIAGRLGISESSVVHLLKKANLGAARKTG